MIIWEYRVCVGIIEEGYFVYCCSEWRGLEEVFLEKVIFKLSFKRKWGLGK